MTMYQSIQHFIQLNHDFLLIEYFSDFQQYLNKDTLLSSLGAIIGNFW